MEVILKAKPSDFFVLELSLVTHLKRQELSNWEGIPTKEVPFLFLLQMRCSYLFLLGGFHLLSNSELLVTETELAAIARPASAGYRNPKPAIGISTMLYANA